MKQPLSVGNLFSDHMVLNYTGPARVWGTADPASTVSVSYGEQVVHTLVDETGAWMVQFDDLGLMDSGPLRITDGTSTIEIQDVVTGEVWLCSGQSNMEWLLADSEAGEQALAIAHTENIRLLNVPHVSPETPQSDQAAVWQVSDRDSAKTFSAVGFFFGQIRSRLGRPIGLIGSNYGASIAEAWIPDEALTGNKVLADWLKQHNKLRHDSQDHHRAWTAAAEARGEWALTDKGILEEAQRYADADFDDTDWAEAKVGVRWSGFEPPLNVNGAIWFRTEFELQESVDEAVLHLGVIENYDVVYVNGQLVGETSASKSQNVFTPRVYDVPSGVLKRGRNVIAVRIFAHIEEGGFASAPEQLYLKTSVSTRVPLGENWKFKIEFAVPSLGWPVWACLDQSRPSGLWNGMISPLVPYSLSGALWYQGESNADRATTYLETLKVLIQSWREAFKDEALPFLIVQLANYGTQHESPFESNWAVLREAQWQARGIDGVETVVAIDVGDSGDIHPRKKLPVAQRLAKAAASLEDGIVLGQISPHLVGHREVNDGKTIEVLLSEPVYTPNGVDPQGFAVLGEGDAWIWAEATISGSTVLVSSDAVLNPKAVRYAWDDNPLANLFASNGLPVAPFRTNQGGLIHAQ